MYLQQQQHAVPAAGTEYCFLLVYKRYHRNWADQNMCQYALTEIIIKFRYKKASDCKREMNRV